MTFGVIMQLVPKVMVWIVKIIVLNASHYIHKLCFCFGEIFVAKDHYVWIICHIYLLFFCNYSLEKSCCESDEMQEHYGVFVLSKSDFLYNKYILFIFNVCKQIKFHFGYKKTFSQTVISIHSCTEQISFVTESSKT